MSGAHKCQKGRRSWIPWGKGPLAAFKHKGCGSWEPRQPDQNTKAPGHSSQLTAATGDPQLHRQKGHCQNWDIITSPSKRIFWLSLLCFLLNNWPPFCRKTKQQTNPYRQYILKRSAVSLPCSSLFQHHIMKSPQYRLKKPTQTTTTINQTKNNPH